MPRALALPILAALLGQAPLPAREGPWATEFTVHLSSIKAPEYLKPPPYETPAEDVLGAGVELARVRTLSRWSDLRAVAGFTGTHLGGWTERDASTGESEQVYVNWRNLRLGLDHLLYVLPSRHWYVITGGGLQESWVSASRSNLLFLTLDTVYGGHGNSDYRPRGSALDGWDGYWQLGTGVRVWDEIVLEVKVVRARHREYLVEGPVLSGTSPVVERWGSTTLFCLGGRF